MILVRRFKKQNYNWGPMPLVYLAVMSAGPLCPGIVRVLYTEQKKKRNARGVGGGGLNYSKLQWSAHSWGWNDLFLLR